MLERITVKVRNILNYLKNDKKNLVLVVGTVCAIIVVIVFLVLSFDNDVMIGGSDNLDGEKFENEYEKLNNKVTDDGKEYPTVKLSTNNNMKYSSIDEIIDIFKNDRDAVIYFGYPTCIYCRSAVQVLCDTALKTELDVIYYLDVEEGKKGKYSELIKLMDNKFTVDGKGEEIYAPLVVFVVNGDIVSYNKGTLFSQEDPYMVLDDFQVEGLSEIYYYGINDVLESISLKNAK